MSEEHTNGQPPIDELLTVTETARFLRVDSTTFRRWIKKGVFQGAIALRSGNPHRQNLRVPKAALAAYMGVSVDQLPLLRA